MGPVWNRLQGWGSPGTGDLGPLTGPLAGTCARPGRDFGAVRAGSSHVWLDAGQVVSVMARQIGLGMTDPQVVLLETRVNALNARVRALETQQVREQDRERPAD